MSGLSGGRGSRRAWPEAFFLTFLLLFAVVVGGVFVLQPAGEHGLVWFSNLTLTGTGLASGLLSLVLAGRMEHPERRSWVLMGAGTVCWGLGQVVWTYYESFRGQETPFPSLADGGYLAMIPLMFVGLVTLPTKAARTAGRLTVGLDAFIVMASIATVSWLTVLGPIYAQADATWAEKLIGLSYPAGDLLLLFALIGGVARGSIAWRDPVVAPLMLGIVLFSGADFAFTYLTLHDAYGSGNLIDLGWPLGFLLVAYAAVRRSVRGPVPPDASVEEQRHVRALGRLAPYPFVLGMTALVFVSLFHEQGVERNIFVGLGLTTVLLVLVRQLVTLHENEWLNQELRSFSQRLEVLVAERTAKLAALHDLAAALCGAASSQEVCQIGLQALRQAVDGKAAVLYLRQGEEYVPAAGNSETPHHTLALAPDIVERLQHNDVVGRGEATSGRGTIWVPVSERGQVYGCITVLDAELAAVRDTQHLATIGAEFGVAYEDQRRFEAAYANEARFRSLVQNSSDIVTVIDADGTICYHSPSAARVFGDDPDQLLGTKLAGLLHPDDASRVAAFLAEAAAREGTTVSVEWRRRHRNGWCCVETIITNLLHDPNVRGLVLNSRDISERKALEGQLTYQAFHDPLTGLANRSLFRDRVGHALAQAPRRGGLVAVLFLDLDNFKTVNDSLGHAAGDTLLAALAGRLQVCMRPGDTVARLGGDEFAILLEDVRDADEAAEVAMRISEALGEPFPLHGKDVLVRASIGIALNTMRAEGPDEILRNADVAMYTAKGRGKGCYELFEPSMHAAVVQRLELEADLRRAMERRELVVHYQPLVELSTGQIIGLEALVRWRRPERGMVPPGEFIPVAEDIGSIPLIDRWVLRAACRQARLWQTSHPSEPPLAVNVNLSASQLQQPGLVQDVAQALRDAGLPPQCLVLEITESVLMQDAAAAVGWLRELKALGVQLAIDDFGTGYSSLSYLQQFPVDILKIDKSFVDELGRASGEAKLPRAIIELGRTLGLKTVAEGIEEQAQVGALAALGCTIGQGYYFARPLAPADLEAILQQGYMKAGREGQQPANVAA